MKIVLAASAGGWAHRWGVRTLRVYLLVEFVESLGVLSTNRSSCRLLVIRPAGRVWHSHEIPCGGARQSSQFPSFIQRQPALGVKRWAKPHSAGGAFRSIGCDQVSLVVIEPLDHFQDFLAGHR